MNTVVAEWRPLDAVRLQQALRLTNEAFAEKLGAAPRTIAKWHANPSMRLTLEMQQALDTMLALADASVQARFAQLSDKATIATSPRKGWRRRLDTDDTFAGTLAWLDGIRNEEPGTSHHDVIALLEDGGVARVKSRSRDRDAVGRAEAANVVRDFYGRPPNGYGTVTVSTPVQRQATTMLSKSGWSAGRVDLRSDDGEFELLHEGDVAVGASPELAERAVERVAEFLVTRMRFLDAPVYRLARPPGVASDKTAFALDMFVRYALTCDLLEAEAADVVLGHRSGLSLRESLLPSMTSVLESGSRVCVGGAQALSAFARAGTNGSDGDFLLLVQERSPRVVNAIGRLAVIPKCFHQPINNAAGEVAIGRTLLRSSRRNCSGGQNLSPARSQTRLRTPCTQVGSPSR